MIAALSRRQSTTPIGLDIGTCGIRAAQLVRSGNVYNVSQVASMLTEHRARGEVKANRPEASGEKANRPSSVGANDESHALGWCVRNCIHQSEFHGRVAAAALCAPDIEYHALELPAAEPSQLAEIVPFEVERLLAVRHDRVETRHWMLPKANPPAPNAIGVAAPHQSVTKTVELCRRAGLVCSSVDTAATALGRAGALLNKWECDDVWGVLDIGYRQVRLVLCTEDVAVLVRTVGVGCNTWTERIAEGLGATIKTAETQKRTHGIALTARGIRQESGDAPASELASVLLGILRGDLNGLASEVKRSYEYVLSCYPRKHAADLIVVGGGAATLHLPEYLTTALGISVKRASDYLHRDDCLLRYDFTKQNPIELMMLAIGVAIGAGKRDG